MMRLHLMRIKAQKQLLWNICIYLKKKNFYDNEIAINLYLLNIVKIYRVPATDFSNKQLNGLR